VLVPPLIGARPSGACGVGVNALAGRRPDSDITVGDGGAGARAGQGPLRLGRGDDGRRVRISQPTSYTIASSSTSSDSKRDTWTPTTGESEVGRDEARTEYRDPDLGATRARDP
jgi:hypothetical protein